ncbi:hypothetical protein Tsubulata_001501 [Turnera subulata]|uniref:Uncharacterized protein n=1 Tax=Turnera subulata TaxID=218843 RepID=A0A9Q0F1I0_9ROSI|nr:hypothetical protein Tsubulata_001501 [Turnera subulata]
MHAKTDSEVTSLAPSSPTRSPAGQSTTCRAPPETRTMGRRPRRRSTPPRCSAPWDPLPTPTPPWVATRSSPPSADFLGLEGRIE